MNKYRCNNYVITLWIQACLAPRSLVARMHQLACSLTKYPWGRVEDTSVVDQLSLHTTSWLLPTVSLGTFNDVSQSNENNSKQSHSLTESRTQEASLSMPERTYWTKLATPTWWKRFLLIPSTIPCWSSTMWQFSVSKDRSSSTRKFKLSS